MDELEKLYNELMWFDKQKFLSKHLGDARPQDIDEYLEDGMEASSCDDLDMFTDEDLIDEVKSRGYIVIEGQTM